MQIIKKCKIHDAIRWPVLGDSGRGHYVYGPPIQIKCRWDAANSQQVDMEGVNFRGRAEVICDPPVNFGDLFLLGKLEDVKGDISDPQSLYNIGICRRFEISTTTRNKNFNDMTNTFCIVYLGHRYGR